MRFLPLASAFAMAGLLAAGAAQAAQKSPAERLAKALEGRTPGKPVSCIMLRSIQSSQIIDDTAILYRVGRTLYVNTPTSGANSLDSTDIMVTDTRTPQLCSVDIVRLVDQGSRMMSGTVGLGQFVPYDKPKG